LASLQALNSWKLRESSREKWETCKCAW
jgi:hypothetical protein